MTKWFTYDPGGGNAAKPAPAPVTPLGNAGSGITTAPSGPQPVEGAGKFTIDMTDPIGSVQDGIASGLGFVGSIGIPGGPNIGGVAEVMGGAGTAVLGAAGEVGIPGGPLVKDVLGAGGDALAFGGRVVETEVAKQRVDAARRGEFYGGDLIGVQTLIGRAAGKTAADSPLPPDIVEMMESGASTDEVAEALVARGAGFTNDPATNLVGQVLFDPLNVVAPGAGAAIRGAKTAGTAIRAADDLATLGVGTRAVGTAYNAASHGLSAGGAALMDKVIGPTTSGVFRALGTQPYRSIMGGLGRMNPEYAAAFDDALALGYAQMPRAVIGNEMADEAAILLRQNADLADDIEGTVMARLTAKRGYKPEELERRAEELLRTTAPDFATYTPESLFDETARKLAAITGSSLEDAQRVLGKGVKRETAQTVHLAYYGRAGDDLVRAKAAETGAKNIDVERLTLVAPDTLTTERAAGVLDGTEDLVAAVDRYSVLANRFAGKDFNHGDVRDFIQKLLDEGALTEAVRLPKTGKNRLPPALEDWRIRNADFGYELGFAPKDGWKVVKDAEGVPVISDPFVHFVSEASPLTMRNPLGRLIDSLFRGTTQTVIVQESRQRFTDEIRRLGLPISSSQARAIHRAILDEAADRGLSPRGLVMDKTSIGTGTSKRQITVYEEIFRRFLTADEFEQMAEVADPTFLVMKAFEGNLRTIGLTQKFTGAVKRLDPWGMVASITDNIYPNVRFSKSPLFQVQEKLESPFFNTLRGISRRDMDPDVARVYAELAELPEFKYMTEAGYVLNIAGGQSVRRLFGQQTRLGKALARYGNVQRGKQARRIAQTLHEHGEEFEKAVKAINPRFWERMVEEYGTSDAREIADRFITERFALGPSEDIGEAMAAFDDASDGIFYHGTTKGAGEAIEREGFDAARFGSRDRGPLAEPDYKGVYVTRDKAKATEYYSTSSPTPTNSVLGGGDVVRVKVDTSRLVPREEWRKFKTQAEINLMDDNGDLAHVGGPRGQPVLDEQVRLAQEAGYVGVHFRGATELLIFDPKDANVIASSASRVPRWADTPAKETIWQAFRDSYRQASTQAFRTHYFSPQRGWLERTINHPYLGIYPSSYMWGKVLPEFARFLLKRPFGARAPLVGYAATVKVQQAFIAAVAEDPEFAKYLEENGEAIYLVEMLIPGSPTNLPANAPAWMRHVSEDLQAGRDVNAETLTREIADTSRYAFGPARSLDVVVPGVADLADIGDDIFANLQKAAAEFDGQFAVAAPQ